MGLLRNAVKRKEHKERSQPYGFPLVAPYGIAWLLKHCQLNCLRFQNMCGALRPSSVAVQRAAGGALSSHPHTVTIFPREPQLQQTGIIILWWLS